MVSLPALKRVMLQASRLIKGAAVADRLTICGVSCLILSKDPVPEMAASLSHNSKRRTSSSATLSQLPTIQETEIQSQKGDSRFGTKSFVGRDGDFRQRDVILHLTGGGFFAHTIASDLPFLMEWSSKTGSVVICPEVRNDKASKGGVRLGNHYLIFQIFPPPVCFAPGESFSCCIESNTELASGDTGKTLGFAVNRLCVTGESAGGNLAAALCVHLSQSAESSTNASPPESMRRIERMPDGLMLSCPALNLTTELSLSRFLGHEDPVLPNSLISAISDAYLPPEKGFNKKDCLASPFLPRELCCETSHPPCYSQAAMIHC
jgi:hypothetical protein